MERSAPQSTEWALIVCTPTIKEGRVVDLGSRMAGGTFQILGGDNLVGIDPPPLHTMALPGGFLIYYEFFQ